METQMRLQVNKRCECDGDYGRLIWRGGVTLKGKTEEWVGVVWDSPTRGKSDGTAEGIRYFDVDESRKGKDLSYSFIKEDRLLEGLSFIDVLKERYGPSQEQANDKDVIIVSVGEREKEMEVELVGKDKVQEMLSHFDQLRSASLSDTRLSHWGEGKQEETTIGSNLDELDLTHTLVGDWPSIFEMLQHLPKLTRLYLDKNSFLPLPSPLNFSVFPTLRVLMLNNTKVPWEEMVTLATHVWPHLEELHYCLNGVQRLSPAEGADTFRSTLHNAFSSLRIINLEGNNISEWDEICSLSGLPKLEKIILNKNPITKISYPHNHNTTDQSPEKEGSEVPFANLHSLSLDYIQIATWQDIEDLNVFPNLTELRLRYTPLYDATSSSVARMIAVSRFPRITILNGSHISAKEREDAEKYYVKHLVESCSQDDEKAIEERRKKHPQYDVILKKHGIQVLETTPEQSHAHTLADNLISLTMKNMIGGDGASLVTATKTVPRDMGILALRQLCHSMFSIPTSTKTVLYVKQKEFPFPEPLDDDMRDLSYYGVREGSEISLQACVL